MNKYIDNKMKENIKIQKLTFKKSNISSNVTKRY